MSGISLDGNAAARAASGVDDATPGDAHSSSRSWQGMTGRLLRLPLLTKLIGVKLIVLLAATAVVASNPEPWASARTWNWFVLGAVVMGLALALNVWLIVLAVRPLTQLEATARTIWNGDYSARVPSSPFADPEIARIGQSINLLLDTLVSSRERMRVLASDVIRAGDRERAELASELHDSTAQLLAAHIYQLSAVQRDADPAMAERLNDLRSSARAILEDVRTLATTTHPRLLDDLGLLVALRALGRNVMSANELAVNVSLEEGTEEGLRTLPPDLSAVAYRVAQEAVRNASRHAHASRINIRIGITPQYLTLVIADDGRGFDLTAIRASTTGRGLFTMQERVTLVNGTFDVIPTERGTTIMACIPLGA